MEKEKRKRYVHIDCEPGRKFLPFFEEIESKGKSDAENLLEDSNSLQKNSLKTQNSLQKKKFQTQMRTLINF